MIQNYINLYKKSITINVNSNFQFNSFQIPNTILIINDYQE